MKRKVFDDDFRQRAIALADRIGPTKAAKRMGCSEKSIHTWRARQLERSVGSTVKRAHTAASQVQVVQAVNTALARAVAKQSMIATATTDAERLIVLQSQRNDLVSALLATTGSDTPTLAR